eukprot:m.465245 g.465245  ORF g.465245 m.465245 type:complete len:69 (+) comp24058_c0_seq1:1349-1555(+)
MHGRACRKIYRQEARCATGATASIPGSIEVSEGFPNTATLPPFAQRKPRLNWLLDILNALIHSMHSYI